MGIKMTCFPNALSKTSTHPSPTIKTMDSSEHMALPLSQCSKIVIEIHQPRNAQAYTSPVSLAPTGASATQQQQEQVDSKKELGLPAELRKTSMAAAHLARSSSSIIGHRRSASRDLVSYGACKKRRADSVEDAGGFRSERDSLEEKDEDAEQQEDEDINGDEDEKATGSVGEAAAAVVVAVATAQSNTKKSVDVDVGEERSSPEISNSADPDAIQVFGIDYLAQHQQQPDKKSTGLLGLGLGLPSSPSSSVDKNVDALQVARASSYVVLEDQKEMGVDYSLFTRVETAGWRILIPPNVVASFRSEDFGLMLKPKGLADADMQDQHDAAPTQEQEHQHMQKEVLGEKVLREDEEEQEEEEVLAFENNEDDDVGTEGVRRIALRDDDSREEESVATVKSVSYYHRHTQHQHQHQHQQQHHVAQDLEMQDDEETTVAAFDTIPTTAPTQHQSPLPSHEGEQIQGEAQGVVKENEQEGDIEMDRE